MHSGPLLSHTVQVVCHAFMVGTTKPYQRRETAVFDDKMKYGETHQSMENSIHFHRFFLDEIKKVTFRKVLFRSEIKIPKDWMN